MAENLTYRRFADLSDKTFEISDQDGAVTLSLDEVKKLGSSEREGGAFSLLFTGPTGEHLPQKTFSMQNAQLGRIDVFLVPLGPRGEANLYEAVFT